MFIQKSAFAVTKVIKQLVRELLELNWNDHLLAEIGTAHTEKKRGADNTEN